MALFLGYFLSNLTENTGCLKDIGGVSIPHNFLFKKHGKKYYNIFVKSNSEKFNITKSHTQKVASQNFINQITIAIK